MEAFIPCTFSNPKSSKDLVQHSIISDREATNRRYNSHPSLETYALYFFPWNHATSFLWHAKKLSLIGIVKMLQLNSCLLLASCKNYLKQFFHCSGFVLPSPPPPRFKIQLSIFFLSMFSTLPLASTLGKLMILTESLRCSITLKTFVTCTSASTVCERVTSASPSAAVEH